MIDRTKPRFSVTENTTKDDMWFVLDAMHNDIIATCSDRACALRIAKHFNADGGKFNGWEERREGKAERRVVKPTDAERMELLTRKMGPEPVRLSEPRPEQSELATRKATYLNANLPKNLEYTGITYIVSSIVGVGNIFLTRTTLTTKR